jgi:anti-sigma regulatory factor (Ser/Thr protein kinase)
MRWPRVSVLELGAYETAPSCARLHTRNVLAEWRIPRDLILDTEMICSELATNALRATWALPEHAPIALRLLANVERLVIEVRDSHPGQPVRQPPTDTAASGRGLQIVHSLSNRWGSRRLSAHLKAVWAELLIPRP